MTALLNEILQEYVFLENDFPVPHPGFFKRGFNLKNFPGRVIIYTLIRGKVIGKSWRRIEGSQAF